MFVNLRVVDGSISIHALLAESDERLPAGADPGYHFYPRSPCGERPLIIGDEYYNAQYFYPRSPCGERRTILKLQCVLGRFLSTLSLRRATNTIGIIQIAPIFLSTLSLRRATLAPKQNTAEQRNFYPRSPCGERPWMRGSRITYVEFLSTLSLRRATHHGFLWPARVRDFYPRSPCGERLSQH